VDRTLISWNVPNLITIPLMAFISFLVVGAVWQLVTQTISSPVQPPADNGVGGY